MLKELMLKAAVSEQLKQKVVSSKVTQKVVGRFIAGETLDSALAVVRKLNETGKRASLDYLGEEVTTLEAVQEPVARYLELIEAINHEKLDANVSVKLSHLGLKLDKERCRENLKQIVEWACCYDNFVRIDMESSGYTQPTLDIFYEAFKNYKNVGPVIQAYLYRSEDDVKNLVQSGARVRLCKGAYLEPASVAFPKKSDVDKNYRKLMKYLLMEGNFPGIATHDQSIISDCKKFSQTMRMPKNIFEFQMLLGIRRDIQDELVEEGHGMRVYTPFGVDWYPYFIRRLAERPANLLFFLNNLIKIN